MSPQYFVQGLFALAGIVSILAAVLNWDWFFNTQNVQFIVKNVGRKRARLFYGILGLILVATAIFFFFRKSLSDPSPLFPETLPKHVQIDSPFRYI
jgi:hypothetical protein